MAKTTVPQYLSATTSIIDSGDATAITIDGSENVAIGGGTNHDGAALLISHGDSGVTTFSDNADELVIENSTNAGISILTPNNASGSIIFGDSDDDDIGKIVYNHNDNVLTVTATSVVLPATSFGDANITNVGDIAVDTVSGDGDADTKIKIGTPSDGISIHCGGADQVLFVDGAIRANTNNDIDLGSSSKKFKDYYGAGTLQADGNATIGGTLGVTGAVTANAGVVVDNITIDGTEIDLSSGDMTIDIAGNLRIDCDDAGEVRFYDGGTQYGVIKKDSDRLKLQSIIENKDILFAGNDGGSEITALSLDMSEAGAATFNAGITATGATITQSSGVGTVTIGSSSGANEYQYINFGGTTSSHDAWQIGKKDNTGDSVGPAKGFYIYDLQNTSARLVIDTSGNIGIGTTSPSAKVEISTADNLDTLMLTSTDADANKGPNLSLYRNSASPADGDMIGQIRFDGENSAGETISYAKTYAETYDITDGTEDGRYFINTMVNGTERVRAYFNFNETVINESGIDVDFRVESDDQTHAIFVDGGNDQTCINASSSSSGAGFHVGANSNKHHKGMSTPSAISGSGQYAHAVEGVVTLNTSSSGDQVTIPVTSQASLWRPHLIELKFISGEYNMSGDVDGGDILFQCSTLNSIVQLSELRKSGNVSGVSSSSMNLLISFTDGYDGGLSDYEGVFMYYKILSVAPNYIEVWNATLN